MMNRDEEEEEVKSVLGAALAMQFLSEMGGMGESRTRISSSSVLSPHSHNAWARQSAPILRRPVDPYSVPQVCIGR
jgi:hypothetical protein